MTRLIAEVEATQERILVVQHDTNGHLHTVETIPFHPPYLWDDSGVGSLDRDHVARHATQALARAGLKMLEHLHATQTGDVWWVRRTDQRVLADVRAHLPDHWAPLVLDLEADTWWVDELDVHLTIDVEDQRVRLIPSDPLTRYIPYERTLDATLYDPDEIAREAQDHVAAVVAWDRQDEGDED